MQLGVGSIQFTTMRFGAISLPKWRYKFTKILFLSNQFTTMQFLDQSVYHWKKVAPITPDKTYKFCIYFNGYSTHIGLKIICFFHQTNFPSTHHLLEPLTLGYDDVETKNISVKQKHSLYIYILNISTKGDQTCQQQYFFWFAAVIASRRINFEIFENI